MQPELAYAIITPYTIRKSRTGAILARLFAGMSSNLVAAQMFACTSDIAERFAQSIAPAADPSEEPYRALIRDYIRMNFTPSPSGRRHRIMMLVFRGKNARRELSELVGRLEISSDSGESIRDSFGDLVRNDDGSVRYFEPAVICSDLEHPVGEDLRMWIDFARHESPVLEKICDYEDPERVEKTLVLIKPDSWRQKSSRPGTIIGMFSRTGLRMIACNKVQMTLRQAQEFYGPVKEVLKRKLAPGIGKQAKMILEQELAVSLPEQTAERLAECVGIPFAEEKFSSIIEFMSGHRPDRDGVCADMAKGKGHIGVLALVYEGEGAVEKIREVLGPTDPSKAPEGTVRREFGSDVMVNTAHASDSPDNAEREMRILNMYRSTFVSEVAPLLQ